MSSPNQDMLNTHLAKADYTGCLLMVTKSKCPSYIGVKGIVIMETKNTLKIICADDKIRSMIMKSNTYFIILIQILISSFIQPYLREIVFSHSLFESGPLPSLETNLISDQVKEPQENSKAGQLSIYNVQYMFQVKNTVISFERFVTSVSYLISL